MLTKKQRTEYARAIGKMGGAARSKNLTAKQRSDSARQAVQARWAKYRAAKPKPPSTKRRRKTK
jgi:RNA processing factor Prp31